MPGGRRWRWCWSPSRASPLRERLTTATFDVYNAMQGFAQLGLLALAIGITMIAGEFDLSVVGTYALGGMLAVYRATGPQRSACWPPWPPARLSAPSRAA